MFRLYLLAGLLVIVYGQNRAPYFITLSADGTGTDGDLKNRISVQGLREDIPVGTVIGVLQAFDPEGEKLEFAGVGQTLFVEINGTVWLRQALDKETKDNVNDLDIIFQVWDQTNSIPTTVAVTISVIDVNDNPPKFANLPYSVVVNEDTLIDTTVYEKINVSDVDLGGNAKVKMTCHRVPGDEKTQLACNTFELFYVQLSEGKYSGGLVLKTNLNYEERESYILTIMAEDNPDGTFHNSASANILIKVGDIQDSPPEFLNAPLTVFASENSAHNTRIGQIRAKDGDTGNPRPIRIIANEPLGLFALGPTVEDPNTDNVYIAPILVVGDVDREARSARYEFNITAVELLNGAETDQRVKSTVTVNILDVNDNIPQFGQSDYVVSVAEMDSIGLSGSRQLPGLNIEVFDIDDASNAAFAVEITSQPYNIFSLDPKEAVGRAPIRVKVNSPQLMDYELPQYRQQIIVLRAYEQGHDDGTTQSSATVTVNLIDVNDNTPEFSQERFSAAFREDAVVGHTVTDLITATDADSGLNGDIRYSLSGNGASFFHIDETTGEVTLAQAVDFESNPSFRLFVIAKDLGSPSLQRLIPFNIDVLDYNDAVPIFDPPTYETSVRESESTFMIPVTVQASDVESGTDITYLIIDGNTPDNAFQINSQSGVMSMTRSVNYLETPDQRGYFELKVRATDNGQPPQFADTIITVNIVDENNAPPIFSPSSYDETISEVINPGQTVLQVTATDADFGSNGVIRFYFESGTLDHFVVDGQTGEVYVNDQAKLDADEYKYYDMVIVAQDNGSPPKIGKANVRITLTDSNNKMPQFRQSIYLANVDEGRPAGTPVLQSIDAFDPDDTNSLQYSIRRSTFQARDSAGSIIGSFFPFDYRDAFYIHPDTGVISTAVELRRDDAAEIQFNIVVRDVNAEKPADQTGTALVLITVMGSVDAAPFFAEPWKPSNPNYFYTVPEEMPVDSLISTMIAFDPLLGNIALTNFRKVPGTDVNDYFNVDMTTGRVTVNNILDYEDNVRKVSFQVEGITNDGQRSAQATINIHVSDMNDNSPKFLQDNYEFVVSENARNPAQVGSVVAYDKDSGSYAEISFSLSGQNATDFSVLQNGPYQAVIYVSNGTILDYEKMPEYNLNVDAADNPRAELSEVRRQTSVPLKIIVTDENDNDPLFSSDTYSFYTVESYPIGTTIGILRATDKDRGINGAVSFSIYNASSQGETLFGLTPSGIIFSKTSLKGMSYKSPFVLIIKVQDQGTPLRWSTARVEIFLSSGQLDDGRPLWRMPPLGHIVYIPENTPAPDVIFQADALPKTQNSNTIYKFLSNSDINENFVNFAIDDLTGEIRVNGPLDRETKAVYDLIIEATDALNTSLVSTRLLTVKLTDVNDRNPSFMDCAPNIVYDVPEMVYVTEAQEPPEFVFQVRACDLDLPPYNRTYYSWYFPTNDVFCNDESATFMLNDTTGIIETRVNLDREARPWYLLCVEAHAVTPAVTGRKKRQTASMVNALRARSNTATVLYLLIEVQDVNDNEPLFAKDIDYAVVFELPTKEEVATVEAVDADKAPYNRVRYTTEDIIFFRNPESAKSLTVPGAFNVNPDNGLITINFKSYTAFSGGYFIIKVRAEDYYDSTLFSVMPVRVYVAPTGSKVRVVIDADPIRGKEKADEMVTYLNEKYVNVLFRIDKVTEHVGPNDISDYGRTDACLIIIDNNSVLSAYEGARRLSDMMDDIQRFGATEPGACDVTYSLRYEDEFTAFWWVLVAFAIFIFIACIICIIIICILYNNYEDYMRTRRQYLVPQ